MGTGKKDKDAEHLTVDLGLGGIFKGLGTFIDLLSRMAETGESQVSRTGEFRVRGLGDKGRGVFGISVRMGIGGVPQVEPFGNIRSSDQGPVVAEVREPLVDVFDEGDVILVVAELPGVAAEEIRVEVQEDILSLETTGQRKYAKEILLPGRVDAGSLQRNYTNGILELRLKKTT